MSCSRKIFNKVSSGINDAIINLDAEQVHHEQSSPCIFCKFFLLPFKSSFKKVEQYTCVFPRPILIQDIICHSLLYTHTLRPSGFKILPRGKLTLPLDNVQQKDFYCLCVCVLKRNRERASFYKSEKKIIKIYIVL